MAEEGVMGGADGDLRGERDLAVLAASGQARGATTAVDDGG
jgi:hypothetical protein